MNDNLNKSYMLTTLDNPYSPFKEFDKWLEFDTQHGYNTCGYLARIVSINQEISELDDDESIHNAMDETIQLNVTGSYIKIDEDSFELRRKQT